MNKFIAEQLNKCEHATIPVFDNNTTKILIPKYVPKKELKLEEGHYYQIEIADYIVNPVDSFTLSVNWNGGTNPPCSVMNIVVVKAMGKMFKVDGVGFDDSTQSVLNCSWTGWLPLTGIKIRSEI